VLLAETHPQRLDEAMAIRHNVDDALLRIILLLMAVWKEAEERLSVDSDCLVLMKWVPWSAGGGNAFISAVELVDENFFERSKWRIDLSETRFG
jgi:hypothetical protein